MIQSGKQFGASKAALSKARSSAYPLLSLSRAIEAAKKIYENLGQGPHSRESLARGLGYASFSGAASGKIGALVHFGLLSRLAGRYSVTDRARAIFKYPGENCVVEIGAAAINPALYRALVARFSGDVLPNALEAVLTADYGITQKAAVTAAANFVETINFAGMVRDGQLVVLEAIAAPENDRPQNVSNEQTGFREKEISETEEKSEGIKIKLPSGVKIIFPDELAYRLSMGEFAVELKNLEKKASGVK